MINDTETRVLNTGCEFRIHAQAGGGYLIVGYAAVFDSLSEDLGGFREIVRPGAFKDGLAGGQDVRGLVNHEPSKLLGRTASGTMRLTEDHHGLRFEIDAPETTFAADVVESIKRGDMDGSSFSFRVRGEAGEEWRIGAADEVIRELVSVDVMDVGPVTFPAYPATVADTTRTSLEKLRQRASVKAAQARLDNLKDTRTMKETASDNASGRTRQNAKRFAPVLKLGWTIQCGEDVEDGFRAYHKATGRRVRGGSLVELVRAIRDDMVARAKTRARPKARAQPQPSSRVQARPEPTQPRWPPRTDLDRERELMRLQVELGVEELKKHQTDVRRDGERILREQPWRSWSSLSMYFPRPF